MFNKKKEELPLNEQLVEIEKDKKHILKCYESYEKSLRNIEIKYGFIKNQSIQSNCNNLDSLKNNLILKAFNKGEIK